MNKKELVENIAGAADISKAAAEKALNSTLAAIAETLKNGDKVTLVGFGTFSVSKREARKGRNPQTGKTIDIPAKNVAKFKAGSKLSEAINQNFSSCSKYYLSLDGKLKNPVISSVEKRDFFLFKNTS